MGLYRLVLFLSLFSGTYSIGTNSGSISCGEFRTGSITTSAEAHAYSFSVIALQNITWETCNSPGALDTDLYLYDTLQVQLERCEETITYDTCSQCTGAASQETWTKQMTPGDYWIEVHGWSTNTGDYRLDMICNGITMIPTTSIPTTYTPTTKMPTTDSPTTNLPTTNIPTTDIPTTNSPTTKIPTTNLPTRSPTNLPTRSPSNLPTTNTPTSIPTSDGRVDEETTNTIYNENNEQNNTNSSPGMDMVSLFIIIGSVLIVVILCILYFMCRRKKKNEPHKHDEMDIEPVGVQSASTKSPEGNIDTTNTNGGIMRVDSISAFDGVGGQTDNINIEENEDEDDGFTENFIGGDIDDHDDLYGGRHTIGEDNDVATRGRNTIGGQTEIDNVDKDGDSNDDQEDLDNAAMYDKRNKYKTAGIQPEQTNKYNGDLNNQMQNNLNLDNNTDNMNTQETYPGSSNVFVPATGQFDAGFLEMQKMDKNTKDELYSKPNATSGTMQ